MAGLWRVAWLLCVAGLAMARPGSAAAQVLQPRPVSGSFDDGERFSARYGFGLAHMALQYSGARRDSFDNLGVAVHSDLLIPISGRLSLRPGIGIGFTEFDRMGRMFDAGVDVGSWTVGAYRTVFRWAGRATRKDGLPRFVGAFAASALLLVPLAISAVMIVLSPLSPFSYAGLDLLAGYRWGQRRAGADLELGWGSRLLIHPDVADAIAATGPAFGGGLLLGPVRLGLRFMWSPRTFNASTSLPRGQVLTTRATVAFSF